MEQTLGDWLSGWRKDNGRSQSWVAEQLGVTDQTISNLESGVTKTMQTDSLHALSGITGMPIDGLLRMVRYGKSLKGTSPVQIATATKEKAIERAAATGITVDEWVTAVVEAVMKLDGWKPGAKVK